jgi:2-polyprenyl-3-methyl-5-hydroxy-6-metoxy-1,4-benzoquinol methylase
VSLTVFQGLRGGWVANLIIESIKKVFYSIYPTTHISAFLRTIYLQKYVRRFRFTKVLDAGCGPGQFTFYLAKKYPRAKFTGYDLSEQDIKKCHDKKQELQLNNVQFKQLDLFELNEEERYDLIYTIDVLEHIVGNLEVIRNLDRALKKEGILYIAMPNEKSHRYLLPEKCFKKYIEWSSKEHIGDQYSVKELASILESLGYKILYARRTFGFFGKLSWELDMLMEKYRNLKRLFLPSLLFLCWLDTVWQNSKGSYAILVIAKKDG